MPIDRLERRMRWIRPILTFVLAFMVAPLIQAQTIPVSVTVAPTESAGTVPVTVTWSGQGATSCTGSGAWSGSKAASGTQTIQPPIAATAKFDLACTAPGVVTLDWSAPTQNTNGTALSNLAGYRVVWGTIPSTLTSTLNITNPAATTIDIPVPTAGTHYFAMHSVTSTGLESAPTNPVSVAKPPRTGTGSATHTVTPVPNPPTNLRVREPVAFDIRPNSTGVMVVTVIGRIRPGTLCGSETRTAGTVTYNRVDEWALDLSLSNSATNQKYFRTTEAWAQCS